MWKYLFLLLLTGCGSSTAVTEPLPPPVAGANQSQPIIQPPVSIQPLLLSHTARLTYNFGRSLVWDADGTCHLCWFEQPPGSDGEHGLSVRYRRSRDQGQSWEGGLSVAEAGYPVVASSGSQVYLAYRGKALGRPAVFLMRSQDGGEHFESAQQVSSPDSLAGPVTLAAEGARVQIAWMDNRFGQNNCEVFTRHSEDGGQSWEAETQASPAGGYSWVPTVEISGELAYLAWVDLRSGYEVEYLRTSRDGGRSWEPEQRLSGEGRDHWAPSLTCQGERLWASWFEREINEDEILAASAQALGQAGLIYPAPPVRGPEVDFVPTLTAYLEALLPYLQQNSPEGAVQVQQQTERWQRAWRIHLATSRDGAQTFEPELVLSLEGPSLRPVLCRDGQRLDVCWFDQRNGRGQLYLRHSEDGGLSWDPEEQIDTDGDVSLPCIASRGGQRLLVYLVGSRLYTFHH